MEKIAIDLRYAENINSGLRFSKNIFKFNKRKIIKESQIFNNPSTKKVAKHLTEFTNLRNNNLVFIIGK